MERKDFIRTGLALCGAALVPAALLDSCTKDNTSSAPTNVNFTLDLTNSSYASLNTVGGSLVANGILIMRVSSATFSALSASCTHQGCTVGYSSASGIVVCPCHGGTYNATSGAVLGGPPPSALAKYTATLSGNTLTVKS